MRQTRHPPPWVRWRFSPRALAAPTTAIFLLIGGAQVAATPPLSGVTQAVQQPVRTTTQTVTTAAQPAKQTVQKATQTVQQPVRTTTQTVTQTANTTKAVSPAVQPAKQTIQQPARATTQTVTTAVQPVSQTMTTTAAPVRQAVTQPIAPVAQTGGFVKPATTTVDNEIQGVSATTNAVLQTTAPVTQQAVLSVSSVTQTLPSASAPVEQSAASITQPVRQVSQPVTQAVTPMTQPVVRGGGKPIGPPRQSGPPATEPSAQPAPVAKQTALDSPPPQALMPPTTAPQTGQPTRELPAVGTTNVALPEPAAANKLERLDLFVTAPAARTQTTEGTDAGHEDAILLRGTGAKSPAISCGQGSTPAMSRAIRGPTCATNSTTLTEPRLTIHAADNPQLVCKAGLLYDAVFNVPVGLTCPVSVASNQTIPLSDAVSAARAPDGSRVRLPSPVQIVQTLVAALPGTGQMHWLARDPAGAVPFLMGSLLMAAGVALRWRARRPRFAQ